MSAWIVSKKHIDVLVAAALGMEGVEPNALGKMLWEENHKSINYRYSEKNAAPAYEFEVPTTVELTPGLIAKQIACYEYQSCEHLGWEDSKARKFCEDLKRSLVPNRVEADDAIRKLPGYEEAPWGIDD